MLNVEFGCSLALNKPVQAIGTDANDWREKSWNNLSQNGPRHRWQGSQSRYRPIAPGNFTESFAPLGPVDSGSFFYAHSANLYDSVGLLVNLGKLFQSWQESLPTDFAGLKHLSVKTDVTCRQHRGCNLALKSGINETLL